MTDQERRCEWCEHYRSYSPLLKNALPWCALGHELKPCGDYEIELRRERLHEWDDDAVCRRCGFDGAEFAHWRQTMRLELGPDEFADRVKNCPEYRMPRCKRRGE